MGGACDRRQSRIGILLGLGSRAPQTARARRGRRSRTGRGGATPDWLPASSARSPPGSTRPARAALGLQAPNRAHDLRTYFEPDGRARARPHGAGSPELLGSALGRASDAARRSRRSRPARSRATARASRSAGPASSSGTSNSRGRTRAGLHARGAAARARGRSCSSSRSRRRARRSRASACSSRPAQGASSRTARSSRRTRAARAVAARFEVPSPERLRIVVDDAGAVYPLTIDPLLTQTADAQLESDQVDARLGFSVAGAGDVNGDGYADVIVGADRYDAGQTDEGAAFVFLGSAAGIASGSAGDRGGASSSANQASADVRLQRRRRRRRERRRLRRRDRRRSRYDAGETGRRRGVRVPRQRRGHRERQTRRSAAASSSRTRPARSFGFSVAGGRRRERRRLRRRDRRRHGYDAGQTDEGAAFVFLGGAHGHRERQPGDGGRAARVEPGRRAARRQRRRRRRRERRRLRRRDRRARGSTTRARRDEGARLRVPRQRVGHRERRPGAAAARLESNQASADFGVSVAGAGDVNGDGYADVIVGAPATTTAAQTDEGAAFVFLGSASRRRERQPDDGGRAARVRTRRSRCSARAWPRPAT